MKTLEMLGNCFDSDTLKKRAVYEHEKPLRETRFNSRKEVMEKSKTALMATDNRVPEMFRELDQTLA